MIRSVSVLGSGVMGAQIAAHLANAGVPTLLLDLTAAVAAEGWKRAAKLKPDPFFTADARGLVRLGGFDADLPSIAESDWIIEAVVERLDAKRELFANLERYLHADAIVSSNTSGIPIGALAEGRSEGFKRRFLGTHFFNPPRYLRLLEIIPTADTDPRVVSTITTFGDLRLGKGVVLAKDTPNFIANNLGIYGVMRVLEALADERYTIEEIDAITGPVLGRANSATFRTMDIAGIDVLAHVARNLADRLDSEADRRAFAPPALIEALVERGWVGEKAGQGFYKRPAGGGRKDILTLDPATMEYRAAQPAKFGSLEAARTIEDVGARIKALFLGKDRVGEFLRRTLGPSLMYAARVAPDIAHSIDDVDRAMKWGFAWELGPFETWDAIGLREVVEASGGEAPPLVKARLDAGENTFRSGPLPPAAPGLEILRSARERSRVVRKNAGASLVDLGDGVLCVELHAKMNAIGPDLVQMMTAGVKEASRNFAGLVIGTDASNFSAGANLMLLLLEAQDENWDDIELMVRSFQNAVMSMKYCDVPVVVAANGLTLAGGCEIALHGCRVQAAAESYIGLVEVGVGLVPAGGGVKEMLIRAMDEAHGSEGPLLPHVQRVFETIGFARTSTSAAEARRLGYLRDVDHITMNRERLIADAKARALALAAEGYQRGMPRSAVRVGGDTVLAPMKLGLHLAWRAGRISDHDLLIGRKLATILAGGAQALHPTVVTEQRLLDLEREAFLSLCGERKTQERIQFTLKTGKPLRN